MHWKLSQCSFFAGSEYTLICFWDFLTFRSRARRHFYGTENEFWASWQYWKKDLGLLMNNFWKWFFHVFMDNIFFGNIAASATKNGKFTKLWPQQNCPFLENPKKLVYLKFVRTPNEPTISIFAGNYLWKEWITICLNFAPDHLQFQLWNRIRQILHLRMLRQLQNGFLEFRK